MITVSQPRLGVIVVAYNAEDFILDCVTSVLASRGAGLSLIVVDNASTDGTRKVLRDWASGARTADLSDDLPIAIPQAEDLPRLDVIPADAASTGELGALTLVEASENNGFAAGVNIGLRLAMKDPTIGHFWILNPDSVATPEAAAGYLAAAAREPGYGLMTGRACFFHDPGMIQIDGGLINRWTGVTSNANVGQQANAVAMPNGSALDFAFGGNMVVSRGFVETCGEMPEDYFLYYEEADWSLRRGAFPLLSCVDGLIYHRAGASIGSPVFGKRAASPFSLYFKHRARMKFMRRYHAARLPVAAAYTLAKAAQLLAGGDSNGAAAMLRGGFGLRPPRTVADRLQPATLNSLVTVARS